MSRAGNTRFGAVGVAVVLGLAVVLAAGCGSSSKSSNSSDTTTTPTTTTKRPNLPNANLTQAQIKAMQADLTVVGCFASAEDGVIGPLTRSAIEAFQKASGLAADGQYGPATRAKLTSDVTAKTIVCKKTSTTTTTTTGGGAPPCTSTAISPAITPNTLLGFGCDSGWAWAAYDSPSVPGNTGWEGTALLKADGTSWKQVDRATACVPASNIPPDVYNPGCTTS